MRAVTALCMFNTQNKPVRHQTAHTVTAHLCMQVISLCRKLDKERTGSVLTSDLLAVLAL
jgi:hypothetical protein